MEIRHDNSPKLLAYSVTIPCLEVHMKTLTISTHKYKHLLEGFANSKVNYKSGIYLIKYSYIHNDTNIKRLMSLLVDIAVHENPVYKNSKKLQDMAASLYDTPIYTAVCKALARYLWRNNSLHLEGYVSFRMSEYREKLDIMSYSLIKKMKLIHKD